MSDPAIKLLNQLKVTELRKICQDEGLSHKGNKGELIARLIAHRGASAPSSSGSGGGPPADPGSGAGGADQQHVQPANQPFTAGLSTSTSASSSRDAPMSVSPSPSSASRPDAQPGRGKGKGKRRKKSPSPPSSASRLDPQDLQRKRGRGKGRRATSKDAELRLPELTCIKCADKFAQRGVSVTRRDDFCCPACRFKAMDPFNSVIEILRQGHLTGNEFKFTLQTPSLRQWRRDGFDIQVQMVRFNDSKIAHAWPHELVISAEGNPVVNVQPPEEGHKRRDVPQSIAAGLQSGSNSMAVSVRDEHINEFVYAILLTKSCDVRYLSKQVPRCRHKEAKARVRTLVVDQGGETNGSDDVVCMTKDTLKLTCPISMDRVEAPVRGRRCKHLQCFGLSAYLNSNLQMKAFNNRWQCPFCTLVLRPSDLLFDGYVEQVLKEAPADVEEVVVSSDGSWRHPNSSSPTTEAPSNSAVVDDLVLDSQDDSTLPDIDGDLDQHNNCASTCFGVTSADVLDIANVHRSSSHTTSAAQNSPSGAPSVDRGVIRMDVENSPPRSPEGAPLPDKAPSVPSDSPLSTATPEAQEMATGRAGVPDKARVGVRSAKSRQWRDLSRALRRPADSAMQPFARSKEAHHEATGSSAALKRHASVASTTLESDGKRGRVASQGVASVRPAEQELQSTAGGIVELDLSD